MGNTKTKFVPGPGTYQPDFAKSVKKYPEFSMKGRYKTAKRLDVPGPGTYDKGLKDKEAAPQYGFGTSQQRAPVKKTLSPGPGGYKIPSMIADLPTYAAV